MDKYSERRLAENEVIFRTFNEEAKDFALEAGRGVLSAGQRLHFYCECSRLGCIARIDLVAEEYERIHRNRRRFILKPGHEMHDVEKVVEAGPDYVVVEKVVEPPTPADEIRPEDFV